MKKLALLTLIGLCLLALPVRAQINLLHEFAGGTDDGSIPHGSLLLSGSTLYGVTCYGGDNDLGTIFKIENNGTSFALLHEFAGGVDDGKNPMQDLILSGSTLYGMTWMGGDDNYGTIFKIETDGSGFTILHEFTGGTNEGKWPEGSLIISGNTLFGMTPVGGSNEYGTIFKMQTDGTGFTQLHEFAGGTDDGAYPEGSLIVSGSSLYGTTWQGGDDNMGTIFKMQTDGSGYTLLYEFTGGTDDGGHPGGGYLTLSDSTLYGMTTGGGDVGSGTIFKIQTNGTGFSLLHEFIGGADDGALPMGSLLLSNSTLYGMTREGGHYSSGTVFKIQNDGTFFSILHKFYGGFSDGANPRGSLINSGSTLYGMTYGGGDNGDGVIFSQAPGITVTYPNGGENWNSGYNHSINWTSTGTIADVNIDYSINNGGSWTPIVAGTANDGYFEWMVPSMPSTTCLMRVQEADGEPTDQSDAVFSIVASVDETLSAPNTPTGPSSGTINAAFTFSTGGSISSLGHTVQYKFDWDDGGDSDWLNYATRSTSHFWAANGTYHIRAKARCIEHTDIESPWSEPQTIIIYEYNTSGAYNSPAQYKVLPEVIWAQAAGSGTWISEVQVTDIMGGSQIAVYYNTASGRRGPFLLWDNSAGVALSSRKFGNLLETIDDLDNGVFTYYGTVGAVEFISQDGNHLLQAAVRTLNGNYSKTFQALSLHYANTSGDGNVMMIPNLTNNSVYRSTCGLFNQAADTMEVELRLFNATNGQIGNPISKTLGGYGFATFNPFTDAGVPYPGNSYDNVVLWVHSPLGVRRVFCFGASANNTTNDPAAHIAVQGDVGPDNGCSSLQILPEAIWAPATGGGTWVTEVQIDCQTMGTPLSIYFNYGNGSRRGPITLLTGEHGVKLKYANILQHLGTLDTGFNYYGRVGSLEFQTQTSGLYVQVTARTLNGNYSKTFPGFNLVEAETADTSRTMLIQNYANNITYRSTCGFYNPTVDAVTVEFTLLDASGAPIGTPFSKTFVGYDFQAFPPFNEAGVPYPANSYDNVILRVRPTSGTGQVICFGASANNASNDPAAHLAVQGQ